eukprot:GEMP01036370.1.p1 GENE.GEMP01036370.1~~GEMP01036370.1.p1  ORF type:complete len:615 (+),score=113.34 GEMP01036370.1:45-1847(+)
MISSAPQNMLDTNRLPGDRAAANVNYLRSISVDSIPEKISLLRKCLQTSPEYSRARLALSSLLMQENDWEAALRELRKVISTRKLKLLVYKQLRATCTFNFALCLYHLEKYNPSLQVLGDRRDADSMQLKAACNFRQGNLLVASDTFCTQAIIDAQSCNSAEGFGSSKQPIRMNVVSKFDNSGYAPLVQPASKMLQPSISSPDRARVHERGSEENEMHETQLARLEQMLERGEYEQCKHIMNIPGIKEHHHLDGARLLHFEPLNVLPAGLLLRGGAIEVSRNATNQTFCAQMNSCRGDTDEAAHDGKEKCSNGFYTRNIVCSEVQTNDRGIRTSGHHDIPNRGISLLEQSSVQLESEGRQRSDEDEEDMESEQRHYYPGDMLESTKEALDPRAIMLSHLPIFAAEDSRLSFNDITEAADRLEVETFEYNSVVIAKGKQPSSKLCGVYILSKGSAKITLDNDLKFSTLQTGCFCGLGLVRDPPTIPKANCVVDSAEATFFKLPKVAFKQLLEKRPQLYARIRAINDPVTPSNEEIEALVQYHKSWQKYRNEVVEQEHITAKARELQKALWKNSVLAERDEKLVALLPATVAIPQHRSNPLF